MGIIVSKINNEVYEITNIERHSGALEADSMRIGKRYIPTLIHEGWPAYLVHADNHNKALVTSPVQHITPLNDGETIIFTTKHTTYTLRKVGDDLSRTQNPQHKNSAHN